MNPGLPWLPQTAHRCGDGVALRFEGRDLAWSWLAGEAASVAGGLARLGVQRGDVVAVRMKPHPRFVALLHALQVLGASMLPLNLRLAEPELQRLFEHAAPRLLLDDGSAKATMPSARDMPCRHPFDDLGVATALKSFTAPGRLDPEAALTLVATSGTTSLPKVVVLTNANHAASAAASRRRLGHDGTDTWLAALPLYHVGGLSILARSALEGSIVLMEESFEAARAAAAIESGEATMVSMVPTMLSRVLDGGLASVSPRLRCLLVGGASLSPSLGRRALDAGLPVSATYGMTEASSQVCSTIPGSLEAARGLVGLPLAGTEVSIARTDGDGWGEILVRGATVMRGYLGNAEADGLAFTDDGWLRTGDLGRLEEGGALAVAGRRGDLVVTGGENVAPLEVEHVLDAHDDVEASLVLGEEDREWGERVVALVVARPGRTAEAISLLTWCRERLAAYKVPREIRFVEALPTGPTGKLLRRGAAAQAISAARDRIQ
ncbi:MAG: o-succinylbenzoate--CoA ligase [Candidatus Binatia bacterium]